MRSGACMLWQLLLDLRRSLSWALVAWSPLKAAMPAPVPKTGSGVCGPCMGPVVDDVQGLKVASPLTVLGVDLLQGASKAEPAGKRPRTSVLADFWKVFHIEN